MWTDFGAESRLSAGFELKRKRGIDHVPTGEVDAGVEEVGGRG